MICEVDLISEVVLLVSPQREVADAFLARGKTTHRCLRPVSHYTYRSLLSPPGVCCLCGRGLAQREEPCVSSGGYHAFVGVADRHDVPELHKAERRSAPVVKISYDEFDFFLEADNLFPIDQILKPLPV